MKDGDFDSRLKKTYVILALAVMLQIFNLVLLLSPAFKEAVRSFLLPLLSSQ
jgi:hypothetical protein